jgi:DNA integrity scanning protein DisA with diadenylate cyclase activity
MSVKSKFPRPLKRLEASDLLTIKDEMNDYYVVTKQETAKVIRDIITSEIGNIPDEISEKHSKNILNELNKKMSDELLLNIKQCIENKTDDKNELKKAINKLIDKSRYRRKR